MMQKHEFILELIRSAESETVEIKERLPPDEAVAMILSAFANTKGGTLIIGVGDKGNIIGLSEPELHKTKRRLYNIASSLLSWPFEIGSVDIDGKHIAFALIRQAPEHLFPVTTSTGASYRRQGEQIVRFDKEGGRKAISKGPPIAIINDRRIELPEHAQLTEIPYKVKGGQSGKETAVKPYIVFVSMSFRQEEEPALVDYYCAMERAAEKAKIPVTLSRIDLIEGDYEISQKLMEHIDNADIVIADFTLSLIHI